MNKLRGRAEEAITEAEVLAFIDASGNLRRT